MVESPFYSFPRTRHHPPRRRTGGRCGTGGAMGIGGGGPGPVKARIGSKETFELLIGMASTLLAMASTLLAMAPT